MSNPLDLLVAEAELGEEMRQFVTSNAGQFILGRAQGEADAAQAEIRTLNPDDPLLKDKLRDIQNRIWRAESLGQWIKEAIEGGDEALETFKQGEE